MWPFPRVIAHRGGGTLAPENTLAGLRCGLAHGYRAVEFDVMLAADGVPVLMHDPAFGRTVPGIGNVARNQRRAAGRPWTPAAGSARSSPASRCRLCAGDRVLPSRRHLDECRDQAGSRLSPPRPGAPPPPC